MAYCLIDIGHGENTFPSNGKGVYRNGKGYEEHHFNSKVAILLKEYLEYNGVKVSYGLQKPFSNDVGLTKRTNYYNKSGADLVFSIHANAGASGVSGRCAFYWHTSNKGKDLAEKVASEIKKKGYSTHGNGLHPSYIGSWTNLHITRETKMPAVLVEHGFMTNDADFELIFGSKQLEYVRDMAEADAKAICAWFGKSYKRPTGGTPTKAVAKHTTSKNKDNLYRVQVGAFSNVDNARNLSKRIKKDGMEAIITHDGHLYRVQVGAFGVRDNAINQLEKLKKLGYKDAFATTIGNARFINDDDTDVREPEPKNPPKKNKENLAVDGYFGPDVVSALQRHFGLIVDGEIWGQVRNQVTLAMNQRAVKYGKGGSPVVRALQKKVGARVDGYLGAETLRKLQAYLGTPVDGVLSRPSLVVKELQRRLNNGTF